MKSHFMFSSSSVRSSLALAFVLSLLGGAPAIVAGEKNANGVVPAEALAREFNANPKAAETAWRDKPVVVTGTVQRLVAGDVSNKAGAVVFKTGEGMPLVKVDFADISDPSATYEFRITDGKTLEVRTKEKNRFPSTYPNMFRGFGPKQPTATWSVLVSVGETVTFSGRCSGRSTYITIANGALLKQGWKGGGAAMLAGNGGAPAGGPEDPAAAFRRGEVQQQNNNQQVQQNMQMNQQNAAQGMNQMLMNQRR